MRITLNGQNDDLTIYKGNESVKVYSELKNKFVETTYADLVTLRNGGNLKKGCFYRITDYVTTTTQEDTQSALHQFDVIVTATDVNKLDENAKAVPHSGDTYFSGSTLQSWELKYCLDNDTDRFAWADTTNGKGVIYYMKDEFNNECPYDFKNIQYIFVQGFTVTYNTYGTRTKVYGRNSDADQTINGTTYYGWTKIAEPSSGGENLPDDYWTTTTTLTKSMDRYVISNGVATIDARGKISKAISQSFTTFTFDQLSNDASISGRSNKVFNNKIASYIADNGKITLNTIYFRTTALNSLLTAYGNVFNSNCYDMNFGDNCYENAFNSNCYNMNFSTDCYGNSFGVKCCINSFGYYCNYNSFGNNCQDNLFGQRCNHNSFGNSCYSNSFGNECSSNSFGNSCYNNSFGIGCGNNLFGNNCVRSSFGNACSNNSFGNRCYNNLFGNNCNSNSFGN